jgi:hypothetical protein
MNNHTKKSILSFQKIFPFILVSVWIVLIIFLLSPYLAKHYFPLKKDLSLERLSQLVIKVYHKRDHKDSYSKKKNLYMIHALDPNCPCSEQILNFLGKDPNLNTDNFHHIILSTDSLPKKWQRILQGRGLHLMNFSEIINFKDDQDVDHTKTLKSVPWLLISDNQQKTIYYGGYSSKKVTSVQDIDLNTIASAILNHQPLEVFKSLGCTMENLFLKKLNNYFKRSYYF